MKKITVLVPCYNEEASIGKVIAGFDRDRLRTHGYLLEVLVIDNNSTDRTAEVAQSAGARIILETRQGKGNAIRTGFYSIAHDTDFVVMLDGDNTYRPEEVLRLIEPIESGFSNVIIGSRMHGRITEGSMRPLNRLGNCLFSQLVRRAYGITTTDVLTGYFAWSRTAIEQLRPHIQSSGFALEMEMITKMARLGERIYSVPISYHARAGESSLRPFRDGLRILAMFSRNLFWQPPQQQERRSQSVWNEG